MTKRLQGGVSNNISNTIIITATNTLQSFETTGSATKFCCCYCFCYCYKLQWDVINATWHNLQNGINNIKYRSRQCLAVVGVFVHIYCLKVTWLDTFVCFFFSLFPTYFHVCKNVRNLSSLWCKYTYIYVRVSNCPAVLGGNFNYLNLS